MKFTEYSSDFRIECIYTNVEFPSCRLVLSVMGFFVFINFYALRVNLSVAIIAMVNSTEHRVTSAANVTNSSTSSLFYHFSNSSTDPDDDDDVCIRVQTPLT